MQIEHSTLDAELNSLMEIERQARQTNDMDLSLSTALKIFDLLKRNGDLKKLTATVTVLCNKRGQFTRTVSEVVKLCMGMIEGIEDVGAKVAFVQAIKDICEKKIFLEVEFARCAMILVKYNEADGKNLSEAAKIIENVQVETYGSMSKYEKVDFILYQMKLNILLNENTKLYIVSKKINKKMLEEPGFHPLKFTFNVYSFKYFFATSDFAEASGCLEAAYDALLLLKPEETAKLDSLVRTRFGHFLDKTVLAESAVGFRLLEPFSTEKLERVREMKPKFELTLAERPAALALIDSFLSKEVTSCDPLSYNSRSMFMFADAFERHEELLGQLRNQLTAKNLFLASKYYKTVRLPRLSTLFQADRALIEEQLCVLIVEGKVVAKINRPEGIIVFGSSQGGAADLDRWSQNVNRLVELVDFVCERIEREKVVQSA